MLEDNRLLPGSQTAFSRNIAYDDGYTGWLIRAERRRAPATVLGDKQILFMKKPRQPLVVGDTVAQAYRRLYKLERVCRARSWPCPPAGRWRCWTKRW